MREPLADILLLMPPELVARVRDYIRVGGGAWSSAELLVMSDAESITQHARRSPKQPAIVLVGGAQVSPELEALAEQTKLLANLVVVPLSDNANLHSHFQLYGMPLGLMLADLTPQRLTETLRVALEWQNTRSNLLNLRTQLELAETRFNDIADLCADWLWEVDTNLSLQFSSARRRPSDLAVKGQLLTASFLPEEKVRIEDDFAELARNPRPFYDKDYWSADRYGGRICWSVTGVPLHNMVGDLVGFRGVARDVSQLKANTDQIYYLSNHDALTGVMNRQRLQDELARTVRVGKREQRTGALVVLDIDRFSHVNQTHGHAVGDTLLIHVAQVLKDNVRTGDVVARLDGDSFAVVLRDLRPEDIAPRLERLQGALASRPLPLEKGALTLNISGGAAVYPTDGDNADDLMANAMDALLRAKQRGPRKIEMYEASSAQNQAAEGHLEWLEVLNECLDAGETRMVLYYQPIIPLSASAKAMPNEHYEVLLRLMDRDGALIAPGKFIATAEEYGLISRIDRLVTLRAIDSLIQMHKAGRKIDLAVNLSGKTFDNAEFLHVIKEALKNSGLPPKAIVFEITETALLRDLQQVKKFMTELREVGAGFALDDCGGGYSSCNYIRQLELDFIKIDGSFVRNLHLNSD
ncbi:MAG: putative bifunctional diguanylate cyclase/phosphodiesterase, partial [Pseudomonadota bacterium]